MQLSGAITLQVFRAKPGNLREGEREGRMRGKVLPWVGGREGEKDGARA